jgi:hypothetical protein
MSRPRSKESSELAETVLSDQRKDRSSKHHTDNGSAIKTLDITPTQAFHTGPEFKGKFREMMKDFGSTEDDLVVVAERWEDQKDSETEDSSEESSESEGKDAVRKQLIYAKPRHPQGKGFIESQVKVNA